MSDNGQRHFFDPHQRATVAAAMARIIPTDEFPERPKPAALISSTAISAASTHLRQAGRLRLRNSDRGARRLARAHRDPASQV